MKAGSVSQLFPVMLSDNQLRYSNYIEMDYYISPVLVSLAQDLSTPNSPFSELDGLFSYHWPFILFTSIVLQIRVIDSSI